MLCSRLCQAGQRLTGEGKCSKFKNRGIWCDMKVGDYD